MGNKAYVELIFDTTKDIVHHSFTIVINCHFKQQQEIKILFRINFAKGIGTF